ncbi:MAG: metallophosphoesterase [Phycisphaerales bacterium]|nr:metallophosphoesterase [Phycisphaerales bacterium]
MTTPLSNDHARTLSRRSALKAGLGGMAALGAASLLSGCAAGGQKSAAAATPAGRTRVLRLAHLTDWHIQPERGAFDGVAACLRHCQSLPDKPEIIVSGGDLIMDGYGADHARTRKQWDLFNSVVKDECSLPIEHTLGNHDIWGWDKAGSKTTGAEAGWGKRWACEMVGRERPYTVRDFSGVRLVILDSVHPDPRDPKGYLGRLDDEQFDWLERTLRDAPAGSPVVVVSHIPILTATVFGPSKGKIASDDHRVSIGQMHADSPRLMELFERSPNVKACLSGHMHLLDRVEYRDVTYLCNGAVSGSWWGGPRGKLPEGYALVDVYSDGSVEREYVGYGWTARPA